ncbi:MAG TPA: T9SS type A sorting domain-containing protein [Flavobacteriales bacterium]
MKSSLSLFIFLLAFATSFSQTPCEEGSGTIVATGFSSTHDGYYQQCVGSAIVFNCEDVVIPGTVQNVEWYVNGLLEQTMVSGSFTLSYSWSCLVQVSARVLSSEGCHVDIDLDMPVAFLSYPNPWLEDVYVACVDDDGLVDMNVSGLVTTVDPSTAYPGPGAFLPDGAGFSYEIDIEIAGITQEYITDCNDLEYVLLNIEHSYGGDLGIRITCPNGTSVSLLQYPNGLASTYLGEPIDDIPPFMLEPGVGYDYYWTMDAPYQMNQLANTVMTIPAGDYLPAQSFCNFIGCPINGTWTITITDYLGMDNGYVFYSGLSFNAGTSEMNSYDYTNSEFNQFSWSSDDFEISNESMMHAMMHVGDASEGTIQYTYTNPAGCSVTTSADLILIANPLTITLSDGFVYEPEGSNLISAYIQSVSPYPINIHYHWSPDTLVANPNLLNTHVLPITEDTWFSFNADITGSLGCALSDSLLVQLPTNAVYVTVFHDANDNGLFDEGENTVPMFPVDTDAGTFYTSMNGSFLTTTEVSDFSVNIESTNWQLTTPATISLDESSWSGYAQYLYFGIKPTNNQAVDVDVSISGITMLCNSISNVQVSVFNHSFYYPGGTLVVAIDSLYVVNYSSTPLATDGNVYTFEVPTLGYNELYNVHLHLINPGEQEFGEETHHLAAVYYNISPGVMSDVVDTDSITSVIICAYDPNDKLTHTGFGDEGFIDPNSDLEYTINFQNIGNAPATTVVITDEITNLLDIQSLQPIAWSHDFVLQVVDNIATFRFEDIQLLGAEQDEELSKGFVRFKIKQQPDLAPGTVIENIAEIVFDNNEAIITNTALNTIVIPTNVVELSIVNLGIYPNPANDVVYWSNTDYRLSKVVNALGMLIAVPTGNGDNQYNMVHLASGTYVLEFEGVDGAVIRKRIIKL